MKKLIFTFFLLFPILSQAQEKPQLKWQFGAFYGVHTSKYMRATPSDGRSLTIPWPSSDLGLYTIYSLNEKHQVNINIAYSRLNCSAEVSTIDYSIYAKETFRFGHSVELTATYRRSFWRNFFVQGGVGLLYLTDKGKRKHLELDLDEVGDWSLTPRIDHKLAPIVLLGVGKSFIFYGKEKAKHQFDFLIQARAGLRHMGEIPFTYTDERSTFHHNQQIYGHALTLRVAYLLGIKKRDKE